MASKNVKRALLGFVQGALSGVQSYFMTKAAQEAERLKEERLAAIRAEERQFTLKRDESQAAAQAERDARQAAALAERDERQAASLAERDARLAAAQASRDVAQGEQRMREIGASGANQLAVAEAYRERQEESLQPTRYLIDRGGRKMEIMAADIQEGDAILSGISPSGGFVPLATKINPPSSRRVVPGAGAGASAQPSGMVEGTMCMTADGSLGRIKNGVCVPN